MLIQLKTFCKICNKDINRELIETHKLGHRNEEEVNRKNAVFNFEEWEAKRKERETPEFLVEIERWKNDSERGLLKIKSMSQLNALFPKLAGDTPITYK